MKEWWFYEYVLKGEDLINWPMCFIVHILIQVKMVWRAVVKRGG